MQTFLFGDWTSMLRVALVGVLAYVALVAFVRISGKRTLSKMNAFDFLVTIALGSTLSSAVLDSSISLAESALAFALLIGLQYCASWSMLRWRPVRRLLQSQPTLLAYGGRFIEPALRSQRVAEDDIHAALRSAGLADMSDVLAVVLESDGSLSVVRTGASGTVSLDRVEQQRADAA